MPKRIMEANNKSSKIHLFKCPTNMCRSSLPQSKRRPRGVTIISILTILDGVLIVFLGASFLAFGGLLIGGIVLAVGIGYLAVSYGLLNGRGWAWTVTVILSIIGIVIQIISALSTSDIAFTTLSIGINAIILYYLYRPNVKAYFGKSPSTISTNKTIAFL